jgi:hypothetical protein
MEDDDFYGIGPSQVLSDTNSEPRHTKQSGIPFCFNPFHAATSGSALSTTQCTLIYFIGIVI